MSRDTNAWEQLLKDTTAGPWMAVDEGHCYEILGRNREKPGRFPIICDVDELADAALIAAAPAAVAEVVRIRRELETLRDGWMVKAEQISETIRQAGMVGEPIMARHYKARAEEVTTILEGDNE